MKNPHKLIPDDFTCMIPLIGGPLCGDSITMKKGRMPNVLPMYHENKCHIYDLIIKQSEHWTDIHYLYSNETIDIEEKNTEIQ